MKYPINWRQLALRELACYFGGHTWKHSPQLHTKYYGMDEEDVPYRERVGKGNYMWENVASWSFKCKRCRLRLRINEEPHQVWYKKLYWAVMDGYAATIFYSNLVLFDAEVFPSARWKRWLLWLPIVYTTFLAQILTNYWDDNLRPSFPITGLWDIRDWLWDFIS